MMARERRSSRHRRERWAFATLLLSTLALWFSSSNLASLQNELIVDFRRACVAACARSRSGLALFHAFRYTDMVCLFRTRHWRLSSRFEYGI
jgi:hypothetical protein